MKMTVQLRIETEDAGSPVIVEVATRQRTELTPETLGLTLAEAKTLLAQTLAALVTHPVAAYGDQQRSCPHCGARQHSKGQHTVALRTLFGKLTLPSPRLATCPVTRRSSAASARWRLSSPSAPRRNCAIYKPNGRRSGRMA